MLFRPRVGRPPAGTARDSYAASQLLWQVAGIGVRPFDWPRPDGQPIDSESWSSPSRLVASMQVNPGRLYSTEFVAKNLTGHDTTAQAVPNIAPGRAAGYFRKTECFCFTPQKFAAHEERPMIVRFSSGSVTPAKAPRNRSAASTVFNRMPVAAT